MLRVFTERRTWLIAVVVSVALLAGVWAWFAASAPERIRNRLEARLGMIVRVGDAHVSLREVRLEDIELAGRHGGLDVRVDEAVAAIDLWSAPFRGARSIRAVSARGVSIDVDVEDAGFSDSIGDLRSKLRPAQAPSAGTEADVGRDRGGGRDIEVSELQLRVSDDEGLLLRVDDASLSKRGGEARADARETLVGDPATDHAAAGPSQVTLVRTRDGWKLRKLDVESGRLRSLRNGDGKGEALSLRVRELWKKLRASRSPSASATPSPDGGVPPAYVPAESSTRAFSRLSSDAAVAVANVSIESRVSSDGHVERIDGFRVALHGAGDGWYRIEVGGQTSNRGTLAVDLRVHPTDVRAEGSVELRDISLALVAPIIPELPLHEPERGTLSAQLDLVASSSAEVALEGGFRIHELAVADERIAAEPIRHVNLAIRGKGAWFPAERRLAIERGIVRLNEARVLVEGELERTPEHYRVDLVAKLPPTDCNDVVGAIPEDVLGSLSRFEWHGNWSALGRLALDSRDLQATELSIRARNLCTFERIPRWVRVERFREPFRHRAVEPDETVFEMVTGPGTDRWVALADVSPFMGPAVISHEDGGFYDHGGFAPWAIRDALVRNLEEGRYVVGASTISMQLAKNLYLQREKTLARKAQEVILTWWLENALTKDEILELYLNVIEYGPAIYGLRPAAEYYFGRPPSDLSPAEAAFLACILPSPKRYHVSYERGELTRSMRSRMERLLRHMAKRERIGPEALDYGLAELDDFRFHRQDDPSPAPRVLPPLGVPETPDPTAIDPYEALFLAP